MVGTPNRIKVCLSLEQSVGLRSDRSAFWDALGTNGVRTRDVGT